MNIIIIPPGEWNKKKDFTPPVYPKSEGQKQRLASTLAKSFMFKALDPKELETVLNAMQEVIASTGEKLIKLGDQGDFLFVVEKGALECRKDIDGVDTLLKTVSEGSSFLGVLFGKSYLRKMSVGRGLGSVCGFWVQCCGRGPDLWGTGPRCAHFSLCIISKQDDIQIHLREPPSLVRSLDTVTMASHSFHSVPLSCQELRSLRLFPVKNYNPSTQVTLSASCLCCTTRRGRPT